MAKQEKLIITGYTNRSVHTMIGLVLLNLIAWGSVAVVALSYIWKICAPQ